MASNRHLGRIIALQTLYEEEFRVECNDKDFKLQDVLDRNIKRYADMVDDPEFIVRLVKGVDSKISELDAILQPIAPDWPISEIARMDRVVLRIGTYELLFGVDAPPKVVINEAVELAKAFGGDNSSKFVNGVLGTVLRNKEGDTPTEDSKPKPKTPAKKVASKTTKTTKTTQKVTEKTAEEAEK